MRKLAEILTILAALSFLGGVYRLVFGRLIVGTSILGMPPEAYWRGATGLLLFAIVLLMLDRAKGK